MSWETLQQIEREHPEQFKANCAHCDAVIDERYTFCLSCFNQLPLPLQRDLHAPAGNRLERSWRHDAISAASRYLKSEDRDGFVWEHAQQGAGWAMQTLLEQGMTNAEYVQMWRDRPSSVDSERR